MADEEKPYSCQVAIWLMLHMYILLHQTIRTLLAFSVIIHVFFSTT